MDKILSVLTPEERVNLSLRAIYSSYGYKKYRMSKFEEYDLYAQNKDFLVSESVITFTDTDGKLLALKPDVTLSIVKNSKDVNGVMKVFYDENVYRISKGTKSYKEIMQSGLECIGEVNESTVIEVLSLAIKSLNEISCSNVLVLSHLDIISEVLDCASVSSREKLQICKLLGDKNLFAIKEILTNLNVSSDKKALVEKLVTVYGEPKKVLTLLDEFKVSNKAELAVEQLKRVAKGLEDENGKVIIDFSVVNDMNYYNGIAFKGFVEGVPTGVISGGEYDNLMKKMNKPYKAIGFAVYLDDIWRVDN